MTIHQEQVKPESVLSIVFPGGIKVKGGTSLVVETDCNSVTAWVEEDIKPGDLSFPKRELIRSIQIKKWRVLKPFENRDLFEVCQEYLNILESLVTSALDLIVKKPAKEVGF